jgi:hypothetical protein
LHVFELRVDLGERADVDGLTLAVAARDAAGSYHELDLAIAELGHFEHFGLPLLNCEYAGLSERQQAAYDEAIRFIDARMPDPIRVPAGVAANARLLREHLRRVKGRAADARALAARDAQARRWVREGRAFQWVAFELGLSDRQLRRIVNGDRDVA